MKNKERAFSLIEVVMALAVLGIAILPILSMYPGALRMTVRATTNEEWSRVSVAVVDYVKSRGYQEIKSRLSTGPFEKNYDFQRISSSTSYKQDNFANDIGLDPDLLIINTKGLNLSEYHFKIYIEDTNSDYSNIDLNRNAITTNSTNSSIIYGIVKIRKKTELFDNEQERDAKFIMTPIENWRN